MKNQNFIFVTFCLLIALGALQFRRVFDETYSEERFLKQQMVRAETLIEKEKMKTILYQNQLLDIQTQIAAMDLPEKSPAGEWSRNLRLPASTRKIDLSALVFSEATKDFSLGKYNTATEKFKELLEKFPAAPKNVEARFLLAESYFRADRIPECLDQIDEMINQYPENRLTGYVMLRMGQIFRAKNQSDKMAEVMRMIIRNFSHEKALVVQAQNLLEKAEK